jgi:2-oxo-4-hydroxy-4-carboxy-5-ureidoimidazoline decarboxylase
MSKTICSLNEVNSMDLEEFEAVLGPIFEKSAWIARETWTKRPFPSKDHLRESLIETVTSHPENDLLALIRAHPDLAARVQERSALTAESFSEQRSSGLWDFPADEATAFRERLAAYREKFGFPFIICARLSTPQEILRALETRFGHTAPEEVISAWEEIQKIATLRLNDLISD